MLFGPNLAHTTSRRPTVERSPTNRRDTLTPNRHLWRPRQCRAFAHPPDPTANDLIGTLPENTLDHISCQDRFKRSPPPDGPHNLLVVARLEGHHDVAGAGVLGPEVGVVGGAEGDLAIELVPIDALVQGQAVVESYINSFMREGLEVVVDGLFDDLVSSHAALALASVLRRVRCGGGALATHSPMLGAHNGARRR